MSTMIAIEQLRYTWPGATQPTLVIDSLQLAPGRTLFLHGPSGCGKSTLLGLLAGVLVAQQGRVTLQGQDWAAQTGSQRDAQRADHVGYVFQQFNLLPFLSVLDNVLLPCRFSPRRGQRAGGPAGMVDQAQTLLTHMGLPATHGSKRADQLSVGQQQRVAAARALIGAPELVIADEPTSALDSARRDDFMHLLLGECRRHGSSLVFVSHDERLATGFDEVLHLPSLNRAPHQEVQS